MPGQLLHQGAMVTCKHLGGQAAPTSPEPTRVRVAGQPVVTLPTPYSVKGCPLPPQSGGPCVSAKWTVGAIRVRVGGVAVLLTDSQSVCVPTGTPLTVGLTQQRVKGK